jgi:glycosyltransferase involved in cell wall biosynthesis
MEAKRVSIIIPVYNGANYLKEAIDSALNQTYQNTEIIVINDGSSDGGKTEEIALSYGDRIRYFSKENGGVATALNLGIEEANGEYISWLSHDDLYLPQKIERQIEYLDKIRSAILPVNHEKILLYSDFEAVEVETNVSQFIKVQSVGLEDPTRDTLNLLLNSGLHGCTLLIPKQGFVDAGLFRADLRTTQDYELWFRFVKKGYVFIHMPEVLIKTRWHEEQGTRALSDIHYRELDELYIRTFDLFQDEFKSFSALEMARLIGMLENMSLVNAPGYIKNKWASGMSRMRLSAVLKLIALRASFRKNIGRIQRSSSSIGGLF